MLPIYEQRSQRWADAEWVQNISLAVERHAFRDVLKRQGKNNTNNRG
nr:MAG TPA: hypothetical protein [Caudoviricetes sp.]